MTRKIIFAIVLIVGLVGLIFGYGKYFNQSVYACTDNAACNFDGLEETSCDYTSCVGTLCPDGATTVYPPDECPTGTTCSDGSVVYPPDECPNECPDDPSDCDDPCGDGTDDSCGGTVPYCPKPSPGIEETACQQANPDKTCVADNDQCPQQTTCTKAGDPNFQSVAQCEAGDPTGKLVCTGTESSPPCANCGCTDPEADNY